MYNLIRFSFFLSVLFFLASCSQEQKRVLVFSKTEGYRHPSIEAGIVALKKMGTEEYFNITATEDAAYFTEDSLQQFSAVIFLNTTGDILDYVQQADFERYLQAGGGFVGIHAATDTEYNWPWYNKLVGAYFNGHPKIQPASLNILDQNHPATQGFGETWEKEDEWYNFKKINPDIKVLIQIDEDTYEGRNHQGAHPMAWYHEYDGGRAFYTGLGHTEETYTDQQFLQHLLGGIQYAIGTAPLDYQRAHSLRVPEENRFVTEVLDFNLDEPMELAELPGRGMLFIERRGAVKLYEYEYATTFTLGQVDVLYENEDGLIGLAVDPNFAKNNWIYLFYSAKGREAKQLISRFELVGDSLLLASEKILLEIPTIRKCCHSGGSIEFGADGLLYIGTGDNTNPFESSGYAPIDERPGRALWDAQKSAANTNDLRGKILRIKPETDGSYSIPPGNLFPESTDNARSEIYVMGCRNPFRFSIDSQTGLVYWGDVGPDAGKPDSLRGPKGMGEFNQARKPGFWGWPYTRGNNQAYGDYDFKAKKTKATFDPNKLINNSPNNTGLSALPPAQVSMIWYSYDPSAKFPWLGKGGVNPMAGPVFHASDYPQAEQVYPKYFENKLFVYEWMRDWIYVITLNEQQQYVKAESFMPSTAFSHPMDMVFGSDGHLYILEYGQKWNSRNMDARLNRIRYIEGNRTPIAQLSSDRELGAAPLTVQFSAKSSQDYDGDPLTYEWSFDGEEVLSEETEPSFTFTEAGIYQVKLKVSDLAGKSTTVHKKIIVGNDPPNLEIEVDLKGETYYAHKKINYNVKVSDTEDGQTEDGSIAASDVKVTLTYIPDGKDLVIATLGHQVNNTPIGKQLIDASDCKSCHANQEKVNGPSYEKIAERYSRKDENQLVSSIIKGSSGIWGETMMSAHPQLSLVEVKKMVAYILSLKPNPDQIEKTLPIEGMLTFKDHLKSDTEGSYVLMASYLDQGHPAQDGSRLSASAQLVFKAPLLEAESAVELSEGLSGWENNGATVIGSIVHGSYIKFANIDFKKLDKITLAASYSPDYHYKGTVLLREGSQDGRIIGSQDLDFFDKDKAGYRKYPIPVEVTLAAGDLFLVFENPEDVNQYVLNADWILLGYGE